FKPKLAAAKAGEKVFDEQDPNSMADDLAAQRNGASPIRVPWMPLLGGLTAVAFVSFGFAALSRRRSARGPQVTKVALQPPTPIQPRRVGTPATPARPKTPKTPRTPRTPRAPQLMPSSGGQVLGKYELGQVIGRG